MVQIFFTSHWGGKSKRGRSFNNLWYSKWRISYYILSLYHTPKNYVSSGCKYAARALSELSVAVLPAFYNTFALEAATQRY